MFISHQMLLMELFGNLLLSDNCSFKSTVQSATLTPNISICSREKDEVVQLEDAISFQQLSLTKHVYALDVRCHKSFMQALSHVW